MNRITNLIFSFLDLIEAEGRDFRIQTEMMLRGIMVLFFGGVLITSSVLLLGFGFFYLLAYVFCLGVPAASFIVAILLGGGGAALIMRGLASERRQNAAAPLPVQPEAAKEVQTDGNSAQ